MGAKAEPLVTVLLAAYRSTRYLAKTVESIVRQSYSNLEILIWDDASPDQTWELILELAKSDARIKARRLDQNIGVGSISKLMIAASQGKYISFIGHDDIWEEDYIQNQVNALEKTGAAAALGACELIDSNGKIASGIYNPFLHEQLSDIDQKSQFAKLLTGNFICACAMTIRNGALNPGELLGTCNALQDWEMWVYLCASASLVYSPLSKMKYRVHSSNLSGSGLSPASLELGGFTILSRLLLKLVYAGKQDLAVLTLQELNRRCAISGKMDYLLATVEQIEKRNLSGDELRSKVAEVYWNLGYLDEASRIVGHSNNLFTWKTLRRSLGIILNQAPLAQEKNPMISVIFHAGPILVTIVRNVEALPSLFFVFNKSLTQMHRAIELAITSQNPKKTLRKIRVRGFKFLMRKISGRISVLFEKLANLKT